MNLQDIQAILSHSLEDPKTAAAAAFAATAILPASYLRLKKSIEDLSRRNNNPEIRKKRSLLHDKFNVSKIPSDIDYIVIGSGMGGLSAAAVLSRLGRKVLVLEQHNDVAGGGTHMFDLKGYQFDSGLHYTVPWSIPLFALTCLKKPKDCVPFDLMTEKDGTIDKIYMVEPNDKKVKEPFRMKYLETHMQEIYDMFPHEKEGIDKFLEVSDNSMHYVKFFLLSKLLPKWLQRIYWSLVPASIVSTANTTAQELLPKFIKDKRLIALLSSMWIDTGARPDKATFMLTASVFRGISKEGGVYPRGGSTEMAKELVTVIESNGGRVLIRSDIERILFDEKANRVNGVRLRNGHEIFCKQGVVSSTGYLNTVNNLINEELANRFKVPRSLPIEQSAGFVMANIGLKCPPSAIGATKANTWHIPVTNDGDIFVPITEYFANPLKENAPIPAFITFPSLKDTAYPDNNKTTCQMLLMAEYDWFKEFSPTNNHENQYYLNDSNTRLQGYEAKKAIWQERCLSIFLRYFPQAKDFIEVVDLSTPLSIQYYLRSCNGGSVGLDVTPMRFCDEKLREDLDPITRIPGLSLTGQDTAICGVTLCQLSGVVTALRLEGVSAALTILLQSILLGN